MCLWGPGIVEWSFKLNRSDQKSGHITAIRVFAADSDFPNSCQVIDVVLFDVGTGKVVDSSFKNIDLKIIRCHGLRPSNRRQRAAAITTQSQIHSDGRPALFESRKASAGLTCLINPAENQALQTGLVFALSLQIDFACGQSDQQQSVRGDRWFGFITCRSRFGFRHSSGKLAISQIDRELTQRGAWHTFDIQLIDSGFFDCEFWVDRSADIDCDDGCLVLRLGNRRTRVH